MIDEAKGTAESELRANLASRLLDLAAAKKVLQRLDQKLIAGGLEELEQKQTEEAYEQADGEVERLRGQCKSLIESLTGVRLDHILEANL